MCQALFPALISIYSSNPFTALGSRHCYYPHIGLLGPRHTSIEVLTWGHAPCSHSEVLIEHIYMPGTSRPRGPGC